MVCRGFSVSAGSALERTSLGEKWQLLVRLRGRGLCSGPLRSSPGNSVYWHEGGGGALPGLSGELSVPADGDTGCRCLLVITRVNLAFTGLGLFGWTPSCRCRSGLSVSF
jgi:hypothetical protein